MKFIAFAAAGLMAAAALTPVPADAQRRGHGYDRGHHGGWNNGGQWRGNHGGYGHRGSRGWRGRGYTRCHYVRGYYGRQRQCYRVYR
jgi:hypothetical protein